MRSLMKMLGLPPALFLLIASQVAAQAPGPGQNPTAIRKMPPDNGAKFFPEYVAFSPEPAYEEAPLSPREAAAAARLERDADALHRRDGRSHHRPVFRSHGEPPSLLHRAAEALRVLERRESCPSNMKNCGNVGFADKCCFEGEECVEVENSAVGNVACCPKGVDCSGGVGQCPSTAVTCPADLGGGCCIAGYICKGLGCVRAEVETPKPPDATTLTTTSTSWVDGSPSTVIVTIVTTVTNTPSTVTRTTVITESDEPSSAGVGAPFRPTGNDDGGNGDSRPASTVTGDFCPTGFYACLARAGGGCCQTGRDCQTTSCPPTPMTTIISGGVTIAIPVADLEDAPEPTCAGGWFLCGEDAGPVAGCCPNGYECGTESCTVESSSETAAVRKQVPGSASRTRGGLAAGAGLLVVLAVLHVL